MCFISAVLGEKITKEAHHTHTYTHTQAQDHSTKDSLTQR